VVADDHTPGLPPGEAAGSAPPATLRGSAQDVRGAALPGVTVVVSGPALTGTLATITDEEGRFELVDVPVGDYTLTFFYADATIERANIPVTRDRGADVHVRFEIDPYEPARDPSGMRPHDGSRQGIVLEARSCWSP